MKWDWKEFEGEQDGGLQNLFKTIIARDFIFTSKCTKKYLAARLRPRPLVYFSSTSDPVTMGRQITLYLTLSSYS